MASSKTIEIKLETNVEALKAYLNVLSELFESLRQVIDKSLANLEELNESWSSDSGD